MCHRSISLGSFTHVSAATYSDEESLHINNDGLVNVLRELAGVEIGLQIMSVAAAQDNLSL